MKDRYPYKCWRLMPSFKPAEVEIVGVYDGPRYYLRGKLLGGNGRAFDKTDLHMTKAGAIASARGMLEKQQVAIDKRQAIVDKKRAALDKAEAAK